MRKKSKSGKKLQHFYYGINFWRTIVNQANEYKVCFANDRPIGSVPSLTGSL